MKKQMITSAIILLSIIGTGSAVASQTKLPIKNTEIYSLKIYEKFVVNSEKECGKLRDKKLESCLTKLINKDANPMMLKRSILVDSGAKVLIQTAKSMAREASALSALDGRSVTIKDLETALADASLGVLEGSSDNVSKITLTVKLNEKGRDLITQNLTVELNQGSVVIKGLSLIHI